MPEEQPVADENTPNVEPEESVQPGPKPAPKPASPVRYVALFGFADREHVNESPRLYASPKQWFESSDRYTVFGPTHFVTVTSTPLDLDTVKPRVELPMMEGDCLATWLDQLALCPVEYIENRRPEMNITIKSKSTEPCVV